MDSPSVSGPYVQAALICEKALQERDGVISAIRIVDRFFIPAEPTNTHRVIQGVLLIMLKSGEARGTQRLILEIETPAGLTTRQAPMNVLFEGEDRGVNLVINLMYQVDGIGLYWFNVLLDDNRLTRIPLRILYQPTAPITNLGS